MGRAALLCPRLRGKGGGASHQRGMGPLGPWVVVAAPPQFLKKGAHLTAQVEAA